jgi:hypothetical protein
MWNRRVKYGNSTLDLNVLLRYEAHRRVQRCMRPSTGRSSEVSLRIALSADGHATSPCFTKLCRYCITDQTSPSGVRVRATISCHRDSKLSELYNGFVLRMCNLSEPRQEPESCSVLPTPLDTCQHRFYYEGPRDEETYLTCELTRHMLVSGTRPSIAIRDDCGMSSSLCKSP